MKSAVEVLVFNTVTIIPTDYSRSVQPLSIRQKCYSEQLNLTFCLMHYVDVTHNKELESVFAHRIKTAGFKVSLHMISAWRTARSCPAPLYTLTNKGTLRRLSQQCTERTFSAKERLHGRFSCNHGHQ